MRRAFISFLTITLICVGVFAATANQHRDGPQVVTVAATTAPPGSVSHPLQFTLTEAFAPLGPWLDGARHAHDVGVMEEAAIYKAQHTPVVASQPTRLVSSYSGPSTVAAPASIAGVMACIRSHESGNYSESSHPGGASGAYQYEQATFDAYAARAGYSQYASGPAYLAPPAVQDAITAYTLQNGGAGNWSTRYGNDPCTSGLPGGG